MEKTLKDRIKEDLKRRGIKIPALAQQTGIPKDRIYGWYRDKTTPKADDQSILEKWLSGEIPTKYEETVSHGTPSFNSKGSAMSTEIDTKSIHKLIESNSKLADAALIRAEADKISQEKELKLVNNNAELTMMLKATAGVPADNPVVAPSTIAVLLEAIVEIGSGKRWDSKEAGIAELDKKLSQQFSSKKKRVGTQSGAGISSTGS